MRKVHKIYIVRTAPVMGPDSVIQYVRTGMANEFSTLDDAEAQVRQLIEANPNNTYSIVAEYIASR